MLLLQTEVEISRDTSLADSTEDSLNIDTDDMDTNQDEDSLNSEVRIEEIDEVEITEIEDAAEELNNNFVDEKVKPICKY